MKVNLYGYFFVRRFIQELIQDLRQIGQNLQFDRDLTREEVKHAWENSEKEKFWPYSS